MATTTQDRFTAQDPLREFEIIAANEMPGLHARLERQFGGIEGMADRRGEERALADARANADRKAQLDAAQFERSTRGMDLSPRQEKAAARRLGLTRALNRASGTGQVRRGFGERARMAESIGGGFGDALFGQRVAGQQSLASAYMGRSVAAVQKEEQKRADRAATGAQVAGIVLAMMSSEKVKDDRGRESGLLGKLKNVRVNRWNYKGDEKTHVGPFAEEFNREFNIDTDNPGMINIIDAIGVTLGAVKELDEKVSHGAN